MRQNEIYDTSTWLESSLLHTREVEGQKLLRILLLLLIAVLAFIIRIRGLGDVGVYHDEKYMVLAVRGILETGLPHMPSEMLYPRALMQLYMMSASVGLFGESEFSFRIPSAIAGTGTVIVAYMLASRHAGFAISFSFAIIFAIYPPFVEISQIARMYIFLVLLTLIFLFCLSTWNERGTWITASAVGLTGGFALDFQVLAILLAPLIAVPVIISPSVGRIAQGLFAGTIFVCAYYFINLFVRSQYEGTLDEYITVDTFSTNPQLIMSGIELIFLSIILIALFLVMASVIFWRQLANKELSRKYTVALVIFISLGGVVTTYLPAYHIAILIFLIAIPVLIRTSIDKKTIIIFSLLIVAASFGSVLSNLARSEVESIDQLIKAMFLFSSPVPFVRFFDLVPIFLISYAAYCAFILYNFSKGDRLNISLVFFAFGVIIPLIVMGTEQWNVAPRYLYGVLTVFLFCVLLAAQECIGRFKENEPRSKLVIASFSVLLIVPILSPGALSEAMNRSYGKYPDHKGAAEFVKSNTRWSDAIIIVMEAPIQTYYLGSVDYLLRHKNRSAWQSRLVDGKVVDIFTATPVLFDAQSLREALDRHWDLPVLLITSGEIYGDEALDRNLGPEIREVLAERISERVHIGRDGRTKIFLLNQPALVECVPCS